MSKKIMLVAGGSDPAGSEIDGTCDSPYNRQNSFGNLLANKLGYEPVNIAIAGSANGGIVRSVLDWFNHKYNPYDDVFVVVGWADGIRMEVPFYQKTWYNQEWDKHVDWYSPTNDDYIRINMGYKGNGSKEQDFIEGYHRFMADNELYLEILSATYALQLQYFLKMKKIKYLLVNTLYTFTQDHPTLQWYKDQIDRNRFLDFDNNNEPFYYKYANMGYKNAKAQYYHHDEVPHKLYADHLFEYITKNNLHTTYK
jgi:hypothetical protein